MGSRRAADRADRAPESARVDLGVAPDLQPPAPGVHMMRISSGFRMGLLGAACLGLVAGVAAQAPADSSNARQGMDADSGNRAIAVRGCLLQERDVPGRQPNVAERMGIGEDFILTNAKLASAGGAAAPADSRPSSSVVPGASGQDQANRADDGGSVSTNGARSQGAAEGTVAQGTVDRSAPMYKVSGLDDDQLRAMVNQEVEIRGELDSAEYSRLQNASNSPMRPETAGRASDESGTASGVTASPNGGNSTIGSNAGGATNEEVVAANELPEIDAQSIRMISSTCPMAH